MAHDGIDASSRREAVIFGERIEISLVGERALGLGLEENLLAEPRHFQTGRAVAFVERDDLRERAGRVDDSSCARYLFRSALNSVSNTSSFTWSPNFPWLGRSAGSLIDAPALFMAAMASAINLSTASEMPKNFRATPMRAPFKARGSRYAGVINV